MKASGSYGNLIQGVSQQAPKDRREGQLGEMVNMLPDPANGLSRRHGSRWIAERDTGVDFTSYQTVVKDTATWRKFEYNNSGVDYVISYRTGARVVGSPLPSMVVFDRTNKVFLPVVRNVVDADLDLFESGGCSAITSIGKYVFAAGHSIVPVVASVDNWGAASNQDKAVVWVRGGAYSRTFKVTATKVDNSVVNFEYTTPKSSYSTALDLSGVPQIVADPAGGFDTRNEGAFIQLIGGFYQHTLNWGVWTPSALTAKKVFTPMTNVYPAAPAAANEFSWVAGQATVRFHSSQLNVTDITINYTSDKTLVNPNYTSIVTALTNNYNSAVTSHIGTAAEAIQPQAIAEQLRLAAVAAGLVAATRQDSTVILEGIKAVSTQDGGDGSLIRGVANEVSSADQVSNLHIIGKVVKVTARGSEESYYLRAIPKNTTVTSGYSEVSWVEGAGISHSISKALMFGVANAGNFYLASSAALLSAILPGVHPTWVDSTVGDVNTSPVPFFIGRKITYLGVFQDRLAIGCGGVLRFSKIGDYLNLFRTSVLTAPANDALEMLSQGSEDDTIMHSVLYDRDLVVFGDKRQYAVSGRAVLSPTNANMPVMSSHDGAGSLPPVAVGGLIFYGKQGSTSPSVHEIRPGPVAESPEAYSISTQLSSYFIGAGVELSATAKPATLFFRTADARSTIYTFSYLDTSAGRQQDAWGKWEFNPTLGAIIAMSGTPDGLLILSLRSAHNKVWVVADVCPMSAGLSEQPYLDSIRPWSVVMTNTGSLRDNTPGDWSVAFDNSTEYQFIGAALNQQSVLSSRFPTAVGMWAGVKQDSYLTPTNPYVKDRAGKAIMTGRLTVTKLTMSFTNSSGVTVVVDSNTDSSQVSNSYVLGNPAVRVGRVPVSTGQLSIPVGKANVEYESTFKANTWLPMTITGIDWVGQFFNNTQRLG